MICRFAAILILTLAASVRGADRVIVIDAGHGGAADSGTQSARTLSSANNAVSPGGLKEKDLTLELSQKIIGWINASPAAQMAGVHAIPTRTTDVNPDFAARAKIAADHKAEWFLSIHFNAVPKGSKKASGTVGIVQMKLQNPHTSEDTAFAAALTAAVNQTIRAWLPKSKPLSVQDDHELHGGQGSNLFYQLRALTKSPITACFLEVEFMDNPAVEKAILGKDRPAAFDAIASCIGETIVSVANSGQK